MDGDTWRKTIAIADGMSTLDPPVDATLIDASLMNEPADEATIALADEISTLDPPVDTPVDTVEIPNHNHLLQNSNKLKHKVLVSVDRKNSFQTFF